MPEDQEAKSKGISGIMSAVRRAIERARKRKETQRRAIERAAERARRQKAAEERQADKDIDP